MPFSATENDLQVVKFYFDYGIVLFHINLHMQKEARTCAFRAELQEFAMLTMRVTPYLHRDDLEAQLTTGISEIEEKLKVADTSGEKEQLETEVEQLRASLDATRAEMAAQQKQTLADQHGGEISFVPSAKNSICSRLMSSFS